MSAPVHVRWRPRNHGFSSATANMPHLPFRDDRRHERSCRLAATNNFVGSCQASTLSLFPPETPDLSIDWALIRVNLAHRACLTCFPARVRIYNFVRRWPLIGEPAAC